MKFVAEYLKKSKLTTDQVKKLFSKPTEFAKNSDEVEYLLSWLGGTAKNIVKLFPKNKLKSIKIKPFDVAEIVTLKDPATPQTQQWLNTGTYPIDKGKEYTHYWIPKQDISGMPFSVRQWTEEVVDVNYPTLNKFKPNKFNWQWWEFRVPGDTKEGKWRMIRIPIELLIQRKNNQIKKIVTKSWPDDPYVKDLIKTFK